MRRADVDEPVEIVAADPKWPLAFEEEVRRLRAAITAPELPLEHIGSTAVSGLAAKPVIDVMLGVDALSQSQGLVDRLGGLGYEDCGGAPGRRYLRRRANRDFNIQIVERDGVLWEANLMLRDFLRATPDAARRYEDAKRTAAAEAPMLLSYSEAKRPAIERLLEEARAWRDAQDG